jgi:hypothetical protein
VITDAYNAMLAQCQRQGLSPTQTPADVFDAYMRQHYRWTFNKGDVPYTLDNHYNLSWMVINDHSPLLFGTHELIDWNI